MKSDHAPRAVGDELRFAPCPIGCAGEGSSIHTAHRFVELGKVPPLYLENQIAALFEAKKIERERMIERAEQSRRRTWIDEIIAGLDREIALLRAWVHDRALPR